MLLVLDANHRCFIVRVVPQTSKEVKCLTSVVHASWNPEGTHIALGKSDSTIAFLSANKHQYIEVPKYVRTLPFENSKGIVYYKMT